MKDAPSAGRKLGITKQAVYEWRKNVPGLENLIRISESSNTSLHWLLTGVGDRSITYGEDVSIEATARKLAVHFERFPWEMDVFTVALAREFPEFRKMLNDISFRRAEKIAAGADRAVEYLTDDDIQEINVEFDVEAAVLKYDEALPVLRDWYAHDRLPASMPPDAVAFDGWDTMTLQEKVAAVQRVRENLDEDREFNKAHEKTSTFSGDTKKVQPAKTDRRRLR